MMCDCLFLFVFFFKCFSSSQITSYSAFAFTIFGCDHGIVLFKEPTVEKTPSPVAPEPTATPIEQKVSPPTGRVSVFMSSVSVVIVVGVPFWVFNVSLRSCEFYFLKYLLNLVM